MLLSTEMTAHHSAQTRHVYIIRYFSFMRFWLVFCSGSAETAKAGSFDFYMTPILAQSVVHGCAQSLKS